MSQFLVLNLKIFGTYKLSSALSISDVYRVLTSGFQLPQELKNYYLSSFSLFQFFIIVKLNLLEFPKKSTT